MNLKPLFTLLNLYIILLKHAEAQFPIKPNAILSPDAETISTAGGQLQIIWTNTFGANVTIVLLDDDANNQPEQVITIARNIGNTGLMTWYISEDLPPSNTYVVRISYDNNPDNYSYSERFAVIVYIPPESLPQPTTLPSTRTTSSSRTSRTTSFTTTSSSNTSTPTNSSPPPPQSTSSGPNIGAIVGAVVGGAALVTAGCLVAYWIVTRRRRILAATGGAVASGQFK
ncbi:hypothetical protein AOL_s00117g47 [Orbilia oligospora ATCC 24927]|uniref:Yeast cell wall synthesis Kre9/Knh1-like N-terminal domain-containing protein n=1 Tax=Arthrobotrys oligospora (strain ATCC 24927 / CBS 115.81 / DSM 1491) TaxID=756982 RepID=G1XM00_ARTOA|nr:hypothetical protein AOL_s00117g47 [Orbilia oligospora ATCC 24927]EGX45842.1 hypothetical protein AOL_s00117g47 [Orbilia oligospora ATCC 24927]